MSVSITPVAHTRARRAGIGWASAVEVMLTCAAILALLPLFDLVAAHPLGRDDRFAASATLLAVKDEAMRELMRTAGLQWAAAMAIGLVFVNWSRSTRSRGLTLACALSTWAVAGWLARVPWALAGEHQFVPARATLAYAGAPASFVLALLALACLAVCSALVMRRAAPSPSQAPATRLGYPGLVVATGVGSLLVLDLSANASHGNRYLALYHQGHLWLAMVVLTTVVVLRPPAGRALAWTLAMADGAAHVIARRTGPWVSSTLLIALAALLAIALGALLSNMRQLTSEIGRVWLIVGAGWFFYMRGTPLAERLARSGGSLASLARYTLPLGFVTLVLVGAMFLTRDMGPLLIAGYGAGAFVAASLAMWTQQRFAAPMVARTLAVLVFVAWIVAITQALFALGALDDVTAGRLENLAAPLASANDQLALIAWFQQAAPPAGFGLGTVPWCGFNAGTGCPGVPAQVQSDYTFTALVGAFGWTAAWALTGGVAVWLHRLVRHHGRVTCGEPRLVPVRGRMVNDVQGLLSWIALAWVVMTLCQLAVTVAGNLAVIPLTGVTFPFVSFGMSSLVVNAALLGLALNINLPEHTW